MQVVGHRRVKFDDHNFRRAAGLQEVAPEPVIHTINVDRQEIDAPRAAVLAQDGRAAAAVVSAVPEIGVAQKGLRYQALLRGVAGVGQVLI